jgi:hypothetical protein
VEGTRYLRIGPCRLCTVAHAADTLKRVKWVVVALSILGGALPLAALIVGARRLIAEHNKLAVRQTRIIHNDALSNGDKTARCREILVPESTWAATSYTSLSRLVERS